MIDWGSRAGPVRTFGRAKPLDAKGCLLLAVAAVVVFGGMGVGVALFLRHTTRVNADQASLTRALTAKPVTSRSRGDRWEVVYRYRAKGRAYYDQVYMDAGDWKFGAAVSLCVDPQRPEIHAVEHGTGCGVHRLYTGTTEAKTSQPPL